MIIITKETILYAAKIKKIQSNDVSVAVFSQISGVKNETKWCGLKWEALKNNNISDICKDLCETYIIAVAMNNKGFV